MPTKLTNRVVLALHAVFIIATAAVVFVTAIQGSLPKAWGPSIAFGIGIVSAVAGATVAVTRFLQGSQQMDAIAGDKELQAAQHDHEHRLAVLNAVGRSTDKLPSETPNLPENTQADTGQVQPPFAPLPDGMVATGQTSPDVVQYDADEEQGPPDSSALPENVDTVGWLAAREPTAVSKGEEGGE